MKRLYLILLCLLATTSTAQAQRPGVVVFEFADTHGDVTYAVARSAFRARGWSGVAAISPTLIGQLRRLTKWQLDKLYGDGWDIMSHGWTHRDPTQMDSDELDNHLRLSHEWLVGHGYTRGASYYGPPAGNCNAEVYDAAIAYYDLIRHFRECRLLPGGYEYRQIGVHDAVPWARIREKIDSLTGDNEVLFLTFHRIVDGEAVGGQTSVARFYQVVGYVGRRGLRVATFSDLADEPP